MLGSPRIRPLRPQQEEEMKAGKELLLEEFKNVKSVRVP